jgi:molecular chaperone GrpE
VSNILDALDDLGRVADLDAATVTAKDVLSGVELVERKILRELETAGLQRVGQVGERFDPHAHEAIASLPAPSAAEDHMVAAVFQPGYRFGGGLLRPARVQVFIWPDPAGSPGPTEI